MSKFHRNLELNQLRNDRNKLTKQKKNLYKLYKTLNAEKDKTDTEWMNLLMISKSQKDVSGPSPVHKEVKVANSGSLSNLNLNPTFKTPETNAEEEVDSD